MRNHLASLFLSFITTSPDPVRIALESDSARWFRGVWISGIVVAVGCGLEIWEVAVDLTNWRRHRKKLQSIPDNPGSWRYPMAALGLVLVVGGIVSETVFEVLASNSDSDIRSHESDVLSIAEQNAGNANHLAQLAQSGNLQLGLDLANAKLEIEKRETELAKEQRKTAEAEEKASEAQLALDKQLRSRVFGRTVDSRQFDSLAKILPHGKVTIWFKEPTPENFDPEPVLFDLMVESELKRIGWEVTSSSTRTNPIDKSLPFVTEVISHSTPTPSEYIEKNLSPTVILARAVDAQAWGSNPKLPLPPDAFILVIAERSKWGTPLEAPK
jgi:hypothetical protein